jgi:AcrR family transcriptional regulator
MPSPSLPIERPVPQQQRSSRRVAEYLDTAAGLFAEVGYEATTMTAIAERAGSSIGGLYRYFPDKPTLALALYREYSQDLEGVWTPLFKEATTLSPAEFAERLMARMADFAAKRPGYLPLLTSPIRCEKAFVVAGRGTSGCKRRHPTHAGNDKRLRRIGRQTPSIYYPGVQEGSSELS